MASSTSSGLKGNPAAKRMANPTKKAKRVRNKAKNEALRAKGQHPKQLRQKANEERHQANLARKKNAPDNSNQPTT